MKNLYQVRIRHANYLIEAVDELRAVTVALRVYFEAYLGVKDTQFNIEEKTPLGNYRVRYLRGEQAFTQFAEVELASNFYRDEVPLEMPV